MPITPGIWLKCMEWALFYRDRTRWGSIYSFQLGRDGAKKKKKSVQSHWAFPSPDFIERTESIVFKTWAKCCAGQGKQDPGSCTSSSRRCWLGQEALRWPVGCALGCLSAWEQPVAASCGIAAAGTATAPRDSAWHWKDPVLLLSSPLGVGKWLPGLCSLFSQHVLLYLKLTFPPHPSQLVECIPKSCWQKEEQDPCPLQFIFLREALLAWEQLLNLLHGKAPWSVGVGMAGSGPGEAWHAKEIKHSFFKIWPKKKKGRLPDVLLDCWEGLE